MMQKLFENFRRFQMKEEETNQVSSSDIIGYKIDGILVVTRRLGRKKADILSDIRAIEGITTVTVDKHRNTDNLGFSELKIKIDTTPLKGGSMRHVALKIRKEIEAVPGVQSFRLVAQPERI